MPEEKTEGCGKPNWWSYWGTLAREEADRPTVRLLPIAGWLNVAAHNGQGATLVRERDGATLSASADMRNWPCQISDFEFAEGEQWTPAQVAAMSKSGALRIRVPTHFTFSLPEAKAADLDGNPYPAGAVGSTEWPEQPKGLNGPAGPSPSNRFGSADYWKTVEAERAVLQTKEPWIAVPGKDQSEIVVTAEMIKAGLVAYADIYETDDAGDPPDDRDMTSIYRAMRALEPPQMRKIGVYTWQSPDGQICRKMEESIDSDVHKMIVESLLKERDQARADGELSEQRISALNVEVAALRERNVERNQMVERQAEALGRTAQTIASLEADIEIYKQANRYLQDCVDNLPNAKSVAEMLAAKDATIADLNDRLASTPMAFIDPDAKPEPAHNPFREFTTDRRRIGG